MEKNINFATYIVRSRKLNFWLQFKGFKLIGTLPSRDHLGWSVFLYKNSTELRNAIDEYREYQPIKK